MLLRTGDDWILRVPVFLSVRLLRLPFLLVGEDGTVSAGATAVAGREDAEDAEEDKDEDNSFRRLLFPWREDGTASAAVVAAGAEDVDDKDEDNWFRRLLFPWREEVAAAAAVVAAGAESVEDKDEDNSLRRQLVAAGMEDAEEVEDDRDEANSLRRVLPPVL